MKTAKEKANELVTMYVRFLPANLITILEAKGCALLAVKFAKDNILNVKGYNEYLDEVTEEINKL